MYNMNDMYDMYDMYHMYDVYEGYDMYLCIGMFERAAARSGRICVPLLMCSPTNMFPY